MLSQSILTTLLLSSAVYASPGRLTRREVPQEHSHEQFLTTVRASLALHNPLPINDPVFGLLGNKAAAGGTSKVSPECIQAATADQAFTNAKAKGDVQGMTAALVYRALERNSGSVGATSQACTAFSPINAAVAALSQHQDPASPNAAAVNKAVTLKLAVEISKLGGDPQVALKAGTFAPGTLGDNTARGNTCDDQNDPTGCIFTKNLIVNDATPAEIEAAVSAGGSNVVAASASQAASSPVITLAASATSASMVFVTVFPDCTLSPTPTLATVTVTSQPTNCPVATSAAVVLAPVTVTVQPTNCAAPPASPTSIVVSSSSSNLQTFTGSLGGIIAPAVRAGGRGFQVDGEVNESDLRKAASLQRSCSIQHNQCANKANADRNAGFDVGACDSQNNACNAAI